jgi:autotransporter adhesin
MNNIFKIIWNKTTQRIEVVSELAKGAVKASSGSHQSKSIAIKSTLKLSLLSLCLGFTNEAMALANIDGNTTFHAPKGGVLIQDENGKYAVGVYDKASASFAFGYAQAGHKGPTPNEPAAVGNKQLAIGNDNITSSGHSSIAIGSNVGDNSPKYRFAPNDGTKFRKGGAQGMYTVAIGAGMQAIGRNVVAIGRESGNGGAYNGYDDAVYLGSYSRINPKGQGQADNINTSALENTYTTAVTNYNGQNNETNLNAIINAGRAINNVALNKVDKMTIKYNVNENSQLNTKEQDIKPVNASEDKTTVSILSIGGENGDNKMYRQIQNVAAGRMSADSFDAVNGSQLYYVRNYTGWNIGHNSNNLEKVTGRVNNDHTVIFKANDNYVNVSTTLDSTNKSTVNIGVNTSDISVTKNNERITAVAANNPTNTVATNTVATATSVKTALETFNEVKADKVDIMGYSHVNSNGNTRDEALLKADGTKATFNYEGRNNSSITNASDGQTKDNNGKYAEASGAQADRSIASGVYANAFAKDSIAIGTGANVNNYWGSQFSESINGIAIGKLAQVEGSAGAIAFGAGSTILRNLSYNVGSANAIAIGNNSKITAASGAIAIGNDTNITAIDTGVGNGAVNAIAIGNGATVERRNSIALGQGTKASAESSIALGNATKVSGTNTVAIGTSVTATKENTVAIGTNVTAAKENSVVIGQNASATMERVVAIGAYAKADGDRTVAIGPEATAGASRSIVIGGLGDDAKDNQAKSESGATQAIVIGNGAQAKAAASYSITLGNSAKTEAVTGISIGDRAKVASGADSGIALGKSAVANKSGDIAIGESSSTSDKHTVSGLAIGNTTLSTGVAATDGGTVSFGSGTIKRQIQNVGAGEISKTSSDVVTGSQLYYVIKAADEIAKTEYTFKVNGVDKKIMRNNGSSATNNANNTLDFKAGDGLDVAYENNAVTYKLNAESKKSISDAKAAAKTVSDKLVEINKSVERAETAATSATTAATNAASSATEAGKSATSAASSATEAGKSATSAASSATAADKSAQSAASSATEAGKSATAADKSAQSAASSATAADKSAQSAASSATAADKSAQSAASSAIAADKSAQSAASTAQRIEDSGLISRDGKTAFAADNSSNRDSAKAKGKDATAMGYGSNASGENTTALGNNSQASAKNATAIGQGAKAKAENAVAIGQGSVANEKDTVSVGNDGSNGQPIVNRRITNVATPIHNTDAVNKQYVDNSVNSVRNELKQTDKKLRGGIAGAVAMANIPTANRAGGTMIGLGVGNFKGQNAIAVGISRSSDNNRIHFKASGSANSAGDYAVGGGIGYQW